MRKRKIGRPKGSKNKWYQVKPDDLVFSHGPVIQKRKGLEGILADHVQETVIKPIQSEVEMSYKGWHISGRGPISELRELLDQLEGK